MTPMQITHEGQTLYFLYTTNNQKRETVSVVKMGRTWATLSNGYRVDKVTLKVESQRSGHTAPGYLFADEAAYTRQRDTEIAYQSLKRLMGYRQAGGVTLEDIKQAAKLLKLELEN